MFRIAVQWMLAALFLLFVALPAHGNDLLVPVSQVRWMSVRAVAVNTGIPESDQAADSLAAPDFGSFVVDTTVVATVTSADASASGSQDSAISGSSVTAAGGMSAIANAYDYEAQGLANGTSHCEVTFTVASVSLFTLDGSLTTAGSGQSNVNLEGPSGGVVSVTGAPNATTPVGESGTLVPGTYSLSVAAAGSAIGDFFTYVTGSASYDVTFTLSPATAAPDVASSGGNVHPNPFRGVTWIRGAAPAPPDSRILIHDVRGVLVQELAPGSGDGTVRWDGRDRQGRPVPAGVYFVRFPEENRCLKVTRVR